MICTTRPTLALVVVLAALAAGCSNVSQLRVDDNSAPVASLRATHRFGGGPGGGGLELDVQSVKAEGRQALEAFNVATLDRQSLTGPLVLRHEVRMQNVQLAYNHRLFAGAPAEFEWFAGAALHRIDWRAVAGPSDPQLRLRNTWWGPAGGVAGRLRLGPMAALELRYAAALEYSNLNGSRHSTELALAFTPTPAVALRVGLAETSSRLEQNSGDSDLILRARGPFAGLALSF